MSRNRDDSEVMSEEAIAKALEGARARIARAERERADLERVVAAAREEERLFARLLTLRRTGTVSIDGALADEGEQHDSPSLATADTKHPAVQAVIAELTAAGRPLHISELMRLLSERGISVPGSGSQANLITHLRRDERLIRPSRGMYGLAAWGLKAMAPGRRVQRRKIRMRSTVSDGGTKHEH